MSRQKLPHLPKSRGKKQGSIFVAEVSERELYSSETRVAFDEYFRYGFFPPKEQMPRVKEMLSEKEAEFAVQSDYKGAKKCFDLRKDLQLRMDELSHEEEKDKVVQSIQNAIDKTRSDIELIDESWQRRIKSFAQDHEDTIDKMVVRHRSQMDSFCDRFEDVQNIRKFSKPSVMLLNMRVRERILLLSNRFPEAMHQEMLGNAVQEEETERKQNEAEREVQKLIEEFATKQNNEILLADRRAQAAIEEMQGEKDKEIGLATSHLSKLLIDLDIAKKKQLLPKKSYREFADERPMTTSELRPQNKQSFMNVLRRERFNSKLAVHVPRARAGSLPKSSEKLKLLPQFD